jgi:hypothetical protein
LATLRDHQKRHLDLRKSYLESLAEAQIDYTLADLVTDPEKRRKATAKELRRLIRNEETSRAHRRIRRILKPNLSHTGLSKIDIPDCDPTTDPDPKEWQGAWKTVTCPNTIASKICAANAAQYHQAFDTPFAQEPLLTHFGQSADGPGVQPILAGPLPPDNIKDHLLPETKDILRAIANLPSPQPGTRDTSIDPSKFGSLYKVLHERKSSSISGRHIGHYKAAILSEELCSIYSAMMYIPHISGFSPQRWRQVFDMMLDKSPGNSKIHRLRIVTLQESDVNQGNRLAFGRPIMSHLESAILLPAMQHGSRAAKLCISAALNKQLQFEIQWYKKQPIVYIKNDATGCYDRIVNPLVLLFLRKIGVLWNTVKSLASTWESTTHRIRTMYGVSAEHYINHLDYFLFGPGQGSTIGTLLWLICFLLMVRALGNTTPSLFFRSVDKSIVSVSRGDAFVDDASLGCTMTITNSTDTQPIQPAIPELTKSLATLAQRWECLLYSTGGALNLQKCFWF